MFIPLAVRRNGSAAHWLGVAVIAAIFTSVAATSHADSIYVSQMPTNVVANISLGDLLSGGQQQFAPASHIQSITGQETNSGHPRGQNYAQTLEIGSYNSVYNLQSGSGNVSQTAIIGAYNNVSVLQSGQDLRSNVALINTAGLNVAVLQPRNSAPVNVLIARLPSGALLIKR